MKTLIAMAVLLMPLMSVGQTPPSAPKPEEIRITINAKGQDVRAVFASLFEQAKMEYVLPASLKGTLYLHLQERPFAQALEVICRQAGVEAIVEDRVCHIRMIMKKPEPPIRPAPDPVPTPVKAPVAPAPVRLSPATLSRKVTVRMQRTDLRAVLSDLAAQSDVTIEVAPDVPAYRIDAFFIKTTLRYALERICRAAKLNFRLGDKGTVEVYRKKA